MENNARGRNIDTVASYQAENIIVVVVVVVVVVIITIIIIFTFSSSNEWH
jgi:hypothetical protein